MMDKGKFVPSLHFQKETANPQIDFEAAGFDVCTEYEDWKPLSDGKRLCSINCFGFGGTNSHAVVLCNPENNEKLSEDKKHCPPPGTSYIVTMSAKDLESLIMTATEQQ